MEDGVRKPVNVNLGSGPRILDGWVNTDSALGARLASLHGFAWLNQQLHLIREEWPPGIFIHDLRKPLPWPDESVDQIYCSHVLEHFTREEGARLLMECARVLCPHGTLRVVVPDLARIVAIYHDGSLDARDFVRELDVLATDDRDGPLKRRLAPLVRYPHMCMYDEPALMCALAEVGLRPVTDHGMREKFPELRELESDERTRTSVIVEVAKP